MSCLSGGLGRPPAILDRDQALAAFLAAAAQGFTTVVSAHFRAEAETAAATTIVGLKRPLHGCYFLRCRDWCAPTRPAGSCMAVDGGAVRPKQRAGARVPSRAGYAETSKVRRLIMIATDQRGNLESPRSPWAELRGKIQREEDIHLRVMVTDGGDLPRSPARPPTTVARALLRLRKLLPISRLSCYTTPCPFILPDGNADGLTEADVVMMMPGRNWVPVQTREVAARIRPLMNLCHQAAQARPWQPPPACTVVLAPPVWDASNRLAEAANSFLEALAASCDDAGIPLANPNQELLWRVIAGDARDRYVSAKGLPRLKRAGMNLWGDILAETVAAALELEP